MELRTTVAVLIHDFVVLFLAPLITATVSLLYFIKSPKEQPLATRLIASAHGLSITVIYVYGLTLLFTNTRGDGFLTVFEMVLVLPIILALISFKLFEGPKAFHFLQILNALCLAWTAFFVSMSLGFP